MKALFFSQKRRSRHCFFFLFPWVQLLCFVHNKTRLPTHACRTTRHIVEVATLSLPPQKGVSRWKSMSRQRVFSGKSPKTHQSGLVQSRRHMNHSLSYAEGEIKPLTIAKRSYGFGPTLQLPSSRKYRANNLSERLDCTPDIYHAFGMLFETIHLHDITNGRLPNP